MGSRRDTYRHPNQLFCSSTYRAVEACVYVCMPLQPPVKSYRFVSFRQSEIACSLLLRALNEGVKTRGQTDKLRRGEADTWEAEEIFKVSLWLPV